MSTQITATELARAIGIGFEPTPQQWRCISAPLGPSVVIAGAGSGKTTLMALRVSYLVLTGQVHPDQVLGLTFTTKAAAELRNRIHAALSRASVLQDSEGGELVGPTVATYNAYAANLLAEHGLRIGHEPDTRVISSGAGFQLAQRAISRHRGRVTKLSDHPATVISYLLQLDGMLSEHLVAPEQVLAFDETARSGFHRALLEEQAGRNRKSYVDPIQAALTTIERRRELLGLVTDYRELKAQLGFMDFGDQISLAAELASQHPDVGAREREKFPVVLLDEYQDTSVSQAILLAALFSGPPDAGLGHAVMAVGDPNQAIYGWRGASVSNILHFERSFPGIGGEVPVYSLSVNQRSDQRILETANALAKPLLARAAQVPPLEAAPGRKNGTIRVNVFASLEQELDWVAAEVKRAHTTAWSDIGVLVRDNQTAATTYDHLTALGIPVEIVGLSGLLRLPEIAEVVATMQLLQSVTANSAVLTLLTGPRWSIGPRDLHLLAQRAQELAGSPIRREVLTPEQQLARIAAGQDETELPALTDALDDPGAGSYSAAALLAFGQLSTQLRRLRRLAGEPVADVVRWIIEITGVDVELASSNNPAAAARRDNLDHFLRVVSEFRGLDGEVTMAAVLAYLSAEDELGKGLELATPTAADSVKLLTMHRAKGLEWKSVFLVGVCETRFPSNQTRPTWVAAPAVIPAPLRGDAADLPQLAGYDKTALDDYRSRVRAHEQLEELRLAYVAVTRPEHDLVVTSHLWDPAVRTPRGPSSYQQTIKELLESWGEPVAGWAERPDPKVTPNPLLGQEPVHFWPTRSQGQEAASRAEAAALVAGVGVNQADAGLTTAEQELVAAWDRDLTRLLGQARQETSPVEVALPSSLSVTALGRLRADPQAFRDELIRPMPRPPSRGARFGSSFHEWVAHRFQQRDLFDPSDVLEPRDLDLITGTELQELIAAFEAGPFADREPIAVEAPFSLLLDGMVIRGRIDAVYPAGAEPGQYLVVDWKTGSPDGADPIQLAVYRLAWAELAGVGLEQISACFHFPRSGQTIQHPDLPGRAELSRILRSVEN